MLELDRIWDEMFDADEPRKQHGNRGLGGYQCECGRFAKFVTSHHYYNGWFDCYAYTVECSRCGEVEVKCT